MLSEVIYKVMHYLSICINTYFVTLIVKGHLIYFDLYHFKNTLRYLQIMVYARIKSCFLLMHIACLNFLSCLEENQKFLISQSLMNFLYKSFEIDAFDHLEFFLDNDELMFEDKTINNYHELLTQFGKLNTAIGINVELSHMYNITPNKEDNLKFPILHYISIQSLHSSKGLQFLHSQSSVSLANDIWLVELPSTVTSRKDMQDLSTIVEALLPNLQLDSQVFVLIPMESHCENYNIYEVYRVGNCYICIFYF